MTTVRRSEQRRVHLRGHSKMLKALQGARRYAWLKHLGAASSVVRPGVWRRTRGVRTGRRTGVCELKDTWRLFVGQCDVLERLEPALIDSSPIRRGVAGYRGTGRPS